MNSEIQLQNLKEQRKAMIDKVCKDCDLSAHLLEIHLKEIATLNTEIQELEKTLPQNEPRDNQSGDQIIL
jgi:hypothetical protein